MTPARQTRKFIIYFFGAIVSGLLLIGLLLAGAITTSDVEQNARLISVSLFLAFALSELITRWLWRLFPFKYLLGIPDLSGRWEGSTSIHKGQSGSHAPLRSGSQPRT